MCYYAPFGSKEMWNWHTTETIKKQQTLEQVLYRVPDHCIRAVKTATSYTDRTKLLYTIALMSTNTVGSAAKAAQTESCSQEAYHSPPARKNPVTRRLRRGSNGFLLIPASIRASCNVNKGVTNGTNRILDTSTAWNKIF